MTPPPILIVGGGLAGLCAAAEIARSGRRVLLAERAGRLGGRAASRCVDGFHINQGPHALYAQGALRRALDAFGVPVPGAPPRMRGMEMIWEAGRRPLPTGLGALIGAQPFSPAERLRLVPVLAMFARGETKAWTGRPFRAVLASRPPRIQAFMQAVARLATYTHAPDLLDAGAALRQIRLAFQGVIYVDGGWGCLVDGLADAARGAGADLRTAAAVRRVARDGRLWTAEFDDGETLTAEAVILATPPDVAAALASGEPSVGAAAARTRPVRATTLDLGLARLPDPDAFFALGADAPVYFSVHSQVARMAPPGGAVAHALRYLAPGEIPGPAHSAELEGLCSRLQPGWASAVSARSDLIGMPVAWDLPAADRRGEMAPVQAPGAPGLYLAGDWVGAGFMLSDAAAASGRAAAIAAMGGRDASPG